MTLDIDQNVLIMSVFDLQDVADQTVSAKRVGEILNGNLVLFRAGFAVLASEIINNCRILSICLFFD